MSTVGIFGLTDAEFAKFPFQVFNVELVGYRGNMRDVIAVKHFLADVDEVVTLTTRVPSSLNLSLRGKKNIGMGGDLSVPDIVNRLADRYGFKGNGTAKREEVSPEEAVQTEVVGAAVVCEASEVTATKGSVSVPAMTEVDWISGCDLAGSFNVTLFFVKDNFSKLTQNVLPMGGVARNGGRYQALENARPGMLFVTSMDYSDSESNKAALRKAVYLTRYVMLEASRKTGYVVESYWFANAKKVFYYVTSIPYAKERTVLKSYDRDEMLRRAVNDAPVQVMHKGTGSPPRFNARIQNNINKLAAEYGLTADDSAAPDTDFKSKLVQNTEVSVIKPGAPSKHVEFWKAVYLAEFTHSGSTAKATEAATAAVKDLESYLMS